ncbi:ATP-binding protein [Mycoplasmopsis bovis]|uniref:ATP-binding protein n=1 Tax=Mycoplasmopsis bovis TaxID=28903 RepID=UPI003D0394F8
MKEKLYRPRVIDNVIQRYLKIAGAICIEGPKWCGKTWTSRYASKSEFLVGSPYNNFANRQLANLNPQSILSGQNPRMIDEWQEAPAIWDAVRATVDEIGENGLFILTGSSTPKYKGILHSGAGRIARLRMNTMSLYELDKFSGKISLADLCNNNDNFEPMYVEELGFDMLAKLIIRGGWPSSIDNDLSESHLVARQYINSILNQQLVDEEGNRFDLDKVKLILKSLARNVSTTVSERSIIDDISQNETNKVSRPTLSKYLEFLNKMFLFDNLEPYAPNYCSSLRVKQLEKRYFSDPSIACAMLNLTADKLTKDPNLYGILFESLVVRDLKIYARAMDAEVYHYQDYRGNEIDAIIELSGGDWAALEIKLGSNTVNEAALKLNKTINDMVNSGAKAPVLKCIIVGLGNLAYKRDDGIIVLPINALKN